MRISVVIPTYNRAHTVCRAIDSVLAQTLSASEVIVVNDGSTDNTDEVLTGCYGQNIKLLTQPENTGVSAARNLAVRHAVNDWIAFLDSDDEWLPKKLEKQAESLADNNMILCHTNEIWIRNGVRVNQMKKHTRHGGNIFHHCVDMCRISPSSVLLSKSVFNDAAGFDESLPACEDYDLWLKLTAKHPVIYLKEPLLKKYGGHADQLSRKYWGMDRFRVQSLHNLLTSGALNEQQSSLAKTTLNKKLTILRKGAIKHGNTGLIAYCDQLHRDIP